MSCAAISSRRRCGTRVVYGLAIGAVLALLYWIVRDPKLVGYVAGGLGATFLLLAVAGWALVKLLAPLRSGVGVAWRYGLANIARRGRDSIVQIVAFGLGFMVLLLLALVRDDLLRDWQRSLPADAPNYFMINIRPDEGAGVEQFFAQAGLPATELVPMLRARLSAINEKPIEKITFQGERANEFVEREANLTWSAELSPGNRIVAGQWWPGGTTACAADFGRGRLRRAPGPEARRHADIRHCRRGRHRQDHEPA